MIVAIVMVITMMPQGAFAASETVNVGTSKVVKGVSEVAFGNSKAYDVNAEVNIVDGKIKNVTLGHNAKESGHENSVSFADKAKAIAESFVGKGIDDRSGIEGVAAISGATVTSDAYKKAVLDALGYNEPAKKFTFGSNKVELAEGEYVLPIALQHATHHEKPSNAASAFPETVTLKVEKDGSAIITTNMKPVSIGSISDMAYDVKYYLEDGVTGTPTDVTVVEETTKPEGMIGAGKMVPTKISFKVPNNNLDGVYLNFTVDAMGPGYPDAWLRLDYAKAKEPGETKHYKGSAKVDQFGKYTIHTDVSVRDGVITNVDVTADNFISETHRPTNEMKIAQVASGLKSAWNGIAATKENAEKIFKTIFKNGKDDEYVAAISGATYSGRAVRDSVMNALNLEYQDEVINVPKTVAPGQYEVDVEYASDIVWHSLVENAKAKALLTVNEDKSMYLDLDLKSGTEKEPLYILGFNGTYPNNDRSQKLTMEGSEIKMGLSSNDYSDENFAKGTQVVNHVKFPLNGGLTKVYNTNAYMYVPAMKRLNGNLSGVYFENGKFNADIFAKIYWDSMKKIGDNPEINPNPDDVNKATFSSNMLHEYKNQPSMCNIMFDEKIDVTYENGMAKMKILVANPVPAFKDQGKNGTLTNFAIEYGGKKYKAKSEINTGVMMTAKATNSVFGFVKGKKYKAQVLTIELPAAAVKDGAMLTASTYVNVVMMTNVKFRIKLAKMNTKPVPKPQKPAIVKNVKVKSDYSLFKVTFNKVNKASSYTVAVKQNGKIWRYIGVKGNSLTLKKLYNKPIVKNGQYYVKVRAIANGVTGNYTTQKKFYANRIGTKAFAMATPKFVSVKTIKGTTKVVVKNIKFRTVPKTVAYKIAYRLKGTKNWKGTKYIAKNVKSIRGLKKGRIYTFSTNYRYKSSVDGKTYVYSKVIYKTIKIK